MKPTNEQIKAIDIAHTKSSFKISAYAGAGKTSTLKLIGDKLAPNKGLYLAFNKNIAEEAAGNFSRNVDCKTFHSMAFNSTPKHITEKLNYNRLLPKTMSEMFDLRDYNIPLERDIQKSDNCTPYDQAMILTRALDFFCRSTDKTINYDLVMNAMPKWVHKGSCSDLALSLVDKANALWNIYIDHGTQFKITHDIYLKYWALTDPEINSDFILFDEAQDADPIMLDILSKQNSQVIYVGDRHQQIYAFRGAVNAMQSLTIPEVHLTKSFRFGNEIAQLSNTILSKLLDEHIPLIGNEKRISYITAVQSPNAYLARTNAGALSKALQLILDGLKPKLNLDIKHLLKTIEDAEKLKNGEKVNKSSDFFGFSNWYEVLSYIEEYPKCDLVPVVTLIENHGTTYLKDIINKLLMTSDTDCLVTTAHKAKGLEFNSVQLCDDYFWKENEPLMIPAEARLLYVACTRAIEKLDITHIQDFFNQLLFSESTTRELQV